MLRIKKNIKQNQKSNLKFKMIFSGIKGLFKLLHRINKWKAEEEARVKLLYEVYDSRA